MPAITEYAIVCPVGSPGTDGSYGYIIYDKHNHCKDRQCQPSVGYDLIDLVRSAQFLAFLFGITFFDNRGDVCVSLVGDDTLSVIIHGSFQLLDLCGYIGNTLHLCLDLVILL